MSVQTEPQGTEVQQLERQPSEEINNNDNEKEKLLAEVQSLSLETRARRVQFDRMQSELLAKNSKISQVGRSSSFINDS